MAEGVGLPESVAHSVDLLIDSLGGLEVLIALYREADRTWTPDQMASFVRMSPRAARLELERLSARGVADSHELGDDSIFRYWPVDSAHAAHVARIAAAYASRRIEVINYVASGTLRRIRPGMH